MDKFNELEMINKNLFDDNPNIIAHGCNCMGKMGSGFAKYVRDLYPECYEKYSYFVSTFDDDYKLLGQHITYKKDNLIIGNLFTQYDYGYDGNVRIVYTALRTSLERFIIDNNIKENSIISIPKIGAGLAGGDWNIISSILIDLQNIFRIKFHVYYF
jgi:O-acetyl-ADP-ribose deacetylase (regulator of RNase III)